MVRPQNAQVRSFLMSVTLSMRLCIPTLILIGAQAAEGKDEPRTLDGFLYAGSDGYMWFGEPIATLGMWATGGPVPEYRLNQTLAKRFDRLVNQVGVAPARFLDFRSCWRDSPTIEKMPTVLMRIRGGCRLVGIKRNAKYLFLEKQTCEVTSAQLIQVEFLSREWLAAWRQLDRALDDIVIASLTVPTKEKRASLVKAIDKGAKAMVQMRRVKVTSISRRLVKRIDPKARVVALFQRHGPSQWRKHLREYIVRLRINPSTPLSPEPREYPFLKMLAQSRSAGGFVRSVRVWYAEEALDEVVLYSYDLQRPIHAWEVAELTPAQFTAARAEAKSRLEEEKKDRKPFTPALSKRKTVTELGVIVSCLSSELMAEKMVLDGLLVDKVLPGGSKHGLRVGDIILTYRTVYDIAMQTMYPGQMLDNFAARAKYHDFPNLRVLRENRIVSLSMKRP